MNYNDLSKAITAEDIIRRYNLDNLKTDRKTIKKIAEDLTNTNTLINNFADAVTKNINELQDQVDGNIATWFFNGIPNLENAPANEWLSEEEKNNHLGDLYYDQDTGYAYRFALKDGEYQWLEIKDTDVTKALALANSAQDTADRKRTTFVDTPSPPYEVGDLWIKEDKDLYRCRAKRTEGEFQDVDWVLATDYSNDDYAKSVEVVLNQFTETVENDYITRAQLETSNEGIMSSVESVTTKVESINESIDGIEKNIAENITEVKDTVNKLQTSTEETTRIVEEIVENGVTKVKTETDITLDKDGLSIDRSGALTGSTLNESGLEIKDKTGAQEETQLYTGYVDEKIAEKTPILEKYKGTTVTYSKNFMFEQYLSSQNWRIEEISDDVFGKGLGFFYVGGDE